MYEALTRTLTDCGLDSPPAETFPPPWPTHPLPGTACGLTTPFNRPPEKPTALNYLSLQTHPLFKFVVRSALGSPQVNGLTKLKFKKSNNVGP